MTEAELKAWAERERRILSDEDVVDIAAAVLALFAERDAAQDGMRQFVERAAKERTRAEAAEAKLAEAERCNAENIKTAIATTNELAMERQRCAAAEAKLAEAERERDALAAAMPAEQADVALAYAAAEARVEALEKALRDLVGNAEDAATLVGLKANGESVVGPWTRRYDEMADALRKARAALARKEGPKQEPVTVERGKP